MIEKANTYHWDVRFETPMGRIKLYLNDRLFTTSGIIVKILKAKRWQKKYYGLVVELLLR